MFLVGREEAMFSHVVLRVCSLHSQHDWKKAALLIESNIFEAKKQAVKNADIQVDTLIDITKNLISLF